MRRERLYLEDILAAASALAEFMAAQTAESLAGNLLLRSAVVHQLTIIGEAAGQLPALLRERHPEVPWRDLRGLRNIIVHNYFGTDWDEVWRTAVEDVPILREQIANILEGEFPE